MRRALCLTLALLLLLCACGKPSAPDKTGGEEIPMRYAEQLRAFRYPGGAVRLLLGEREELLLLPAGAEVPAGLEALPQIRTPVERVYLASSSAGDFFVRLDALDSLSFSSTRPESWQIPELKAAMEEGKLLYAGKYSAPDYELLLEEACGLALENTMLLHTPETREKLEKLGLPLLIEYSSYESHPLGRVEWIKLYGLLTGKEAEAEAFFEKQCAQVEKSGAAPASGRRAAFFYLGANGAVVVRRKQDYVTRMIELAGGESAITEGNDGEGALSTASIQLESFYAQARDADVLIYNGTVSASPESLEDLLALCPLLADCRAVREGAVWCTEQSLFQRSAAAGDMIADFREILGDAPDERKLQYFHRLR